MVELVDSVPRETELVLSPSSCSVRELEPTPVVMRVVRVEARLVEVLPEVESLEVELLVEEMQEVEMLVVELLEEELLVVESPEEAMLEVGR